MLQQLVHEEAVRRMDNRPVYNLTFDTVLVAAIQRLKQQTKLDINPGLKR